MKIIKIAAIFFLLTITCRAEEVDAVQPNIDIVIDAGHGGIDGGTTYHNLFEKDINLQIGKLLYQVFQQKGYRVVLNRTDDYALSDENRWLRNPSRHLRDLAQRKHLAMELAPQLMISLHANWSRSAERSGPLVLYQKNDQSYFLAKLLQHSLNSLYGTNYVAVKGDTYYVLKQSACPSVIVEMGFISNANDRYRMTHPDKQKEIAVTIANAVDEYLLLVGEINERTESQSD